MTNLLKANLWTTSRQVVHGQRYRFWLSPSFKEEGCPGCPEDSESQADVSGQPLAQPPAQPIAQPPLLAESTVQEMAVPNLPNLPNHFPRSTREPDPDPISTPLDVGDKVEILSGQFSGKHVFVEELLPSGVQVKHLNWSVSRNYNRSDLKLLRRVEEAEPCQ
uniref:hypothetical protein n=1 Tax=Trichocoleus desertorum TaxID=1481672 RepID=UPI0025B4D425|nr:hypothetical protein [Trichocoleus desertorum]